MKISIIGAGLVGTTTCQNICLKNFADDIVLVDIHPSVEGKVMDIMQSKILNNFNTNVISLYDDNISDCYEKTRNSDIGIITCGLPRKPGMTREELIGINSNIVSGVAHKLINYSPDIILIVVTNPVDIMTYLLNLELNIPSYRIIGMGGILDTTRFKYYIKEELGLINEKIEALVVGSHTDSHMIPLVNRVTIDNDNLTNVTDSDTINRIVYNTKNGGAIITNIQGYSAGYAPAAAICTLVESIVKDSKRILCCSVLLGADSLSQVHTPYEYGVTNVCIGVPVIIGKNGVENIIQLGLNENEQKLFNDSANDLILKNKCIIGNYNK